jgi:nucleotidyltransferase/DNA polymerase involved in DNA repair
VYSFECECLRTGRPTNPSGTVLGVNSPFAERILHVDMDAFFVEVERRRRPELRGRPVLVGGLGPRAVVAAASYEARAFGVGSAMPMIEARRRCQGAILIPPDHGEYASASRDVFEVLRSFTPLVEGLSVDEAFLDISGLRLHFERPAVVADEIRHSLRREVGLPASVGAAGNKFIAKLASEDAKPDGVFIVPVGHETDFLAPMSVRRLWGVGEATFAGLSSLSIGTVGQLAAAPVESLCRRLGSSLGQHLWNLAHGHDDRPVVPRSGSRSISVERTYPTDLVAPTAIEDGVFAHCSALSARLSASAVMARTIKLKVRFGDFTTLTRALSTDVGISQSGDIWDICRQLLAEIDYAGRGVRLLGVGAVGLVAASAPLQLSMNEREGSAAARAAEQVRARFGDGSVIPARLAPSPPDRRHGDPR